LYFGVLLHRSLYEDALKIQESLRQIKARRDGGQSAHADRREAQRDPRVVGDESSRADKSGRTRRGENQ